MSAVFKRLLPISLVLVLVFGCTATRHDQAQGELAIPLAKITLPESVTTVRIADYSVVSRFTRVVQIVRLRDGQVLALAAEDPNGGCTVPWNGQVHAFWNPCHGAKYNARGELIEGFGDRGLDRFPVRVSIEDQMVYVDLANPPVPGPAW